MSWFLMRVDPPELTVALTIVTALAGKGVRP
jgi:hypothetical protein